MNDTALIFENIFFWSFKTLVTESNHDSAVQECKFLQTLQKNIKIISRSLSENSFVGLPSDCSSVSLSVADDFYLCNRNSALVLLTIDVTVTADSSFKPVRKSIHAGNTYTMQTARNFISIFIEFTARMKTSQNKFQSTYFFGWMNINRNTSSVILNANNIVLFKSNNDIITIACHSFIDTVVYSLINKMMQAFRTS